MSVLILGASGFLGSHVATALQASGHSVITLGRSDAVDVRMDATDLDQLKSLLREVEPTAVINLLGAGLSDPSANLDEMEEVNAHFPPRLAELLALVGGAHLIHAASSTEVAALDGSFESEYSRTKAQGTSALLARESELPITILRVHNTYGGDQPARRFVASAIDSVAAGRSIELRYPDRVRDFVHVDDVAASFVAAVGAQPAGCVMYEVGTGIGMSLGSVVRTIAELLGRDDPVLASPSVEDLHPVTVASQDLLLRPATIELSHGLERTISERLRKGEDA